MKDEMTSSQTQAKPGKVRLDGYTRGCLTVIAVLLTVLILGLWSDMSFSRSARAAEDGFGDSSAIRKDMLKAQEQTNVKLDDLMKLLKSGEVKVQVSAPDDASAKK